MAQAIQRRSGGTGLGKDSGQSTVEWIGLVLLVAVLATITATGTGIPGPGLAHAISTRILCAASLSPCPDGGSGEGLLERAYGPELASLVRARAPTLMYGRDMLGLPVDFRTCRSPYCADGVGEGKVTHSTAGEPVTLFTRVIRCGDSAGTRCEDDGATHIEYWAYYPESASLRGAPMLEEKGYHRNDWEARQVRIGPDGTISERASSHSGYNHTRSALNWGSDLGWGFLRDAAERVGLREEGGWGEATGRYLIAGGSHAGNVAGPAGHLDYPSYTPSQAVRLVPLEAVMDGPLSRPAQFDPITPPWRKRVWNEPETTGTG